MRLHVLGSGGFMPFPDAHMPGFLVQYQGEHHLLDAGEGTQTRMVEANLARSKLRSVFISHLHGDHILGLPGVLIRRSREGQPDDPLDLYGPDGLADYVTCTQRTLSLQLQCPLRVHGLEGEGSYRPGEVDVTAVSLDHRTETYGFAVEGRKTRRRFHPDRARELGVPQGPLWGRLQRGETVRLEDGRTIQPEQVSDPPPRGPRVVYLPDSRPLDEFSDPFREPDLLIHEAMFMETDRDHAVDKMHSTAREAGRVARRLGARKLMVTHFSRRYSDPDLLVEEAREEFPDVIRARDGLCLEISPPETDPGTGGAAA